MAGLIILIVMFIFSFIGGMVSPYQESQVFRKTEAAWEGIMRERLTMTATSFALWTV